MTTAHSRFGGSNAHRWMNCPFSARADHQYQDKPSDASKRGDRIHKAADDLWHDRNVVLEESEKKIATEYVAAIRNLNHAGEVEYRAKLSSVHAEAFGTVDFVAFDGNRLTVVDLKTGDNVVQAVNNMQLVFYALAVMETMNINPNKFRLGIWQNGKFMWWEPTKDQIVTYHFQMIDAAAKCDTAAPSIGTWCNYCKVKDCPEQMEIKKNIVNLINKTKNLTSW